MRTKVIIAREDQLRQLCVRLALTQQLSANSASLVVAFVLLGFIVQIVALYTQPCVVRVVISVKLGHLP